ncbi:MAG TPA: type II toxin-antitoxin system VapC family toxin [Ilumatobacter sp.]|nr:type II toxin-antitoxin system VapC family toxin [Ilumatobacter sp.]
MYVLDTNVVSELRKVAAGKADANVAGWAAGTPAATMFVSAITILELETGVVLAERSDPTKGRVLRQWFEAGVLRAFADRVLPVDIDVARAAAQLHVPNPAPYRDALIGATALVHGMTVVTRNVGDFARFDRPVVVNPWDQN